jgi:hypothetical protein
MSALGGKRTFTALAFIQQKETLMKRLVLRNTSGGKLTVMLEPITFTEDVGTDGSIVVSGDFSDDDLLIDVSCDGDGAFLSVWSPPHAVIASDPAPG